MEYLIFFIISAIIVLVAIKVQRNQKKLSKEDDTWLQERQTEEPLEEQSHQKKDEELRSDGPPQKVSRGVIGYLLTGIFALFALLFFVSLWEDLDRRIQMIEFVVVGTFVTGIYWLVGFFCKSTFDFEIRNKIGYTICAASYPIIMNLLKIILANQ